jgi:hypothetical protein
LTSNGKADVLSPVEVSCEIGSSNLVVEEAKVSVFFASLGQLLFISNQSPGSLESTGDQFALNRSDFGQIWLKGILIFAV